MFFLWTLIFSADVLSVLAQFNSHVGGSAYLYAKNTEVTLQHYITWKVEGVTAAIASLSPGLTASYSGRCTAGKCQLFSNGTLRVDQLTTADNKTFIITTKLGNVEVNEQVKLDIYNLLTPPTLTSSSSIRPVNGTTLRLTCNAGAQTVHNVYFYVNSQLVNCSMPHLSCNDSSPILNFSPILDIDTGNYSCVIRNPVSQNSSTHLFVNVAVQVSEVTLRNNATRPITVEKDSVALTCSSYGTDVSYNWTFMGSPLPQNSRYRLTNDNSTLIISPVTRNDQGAFTCGVTNYLNGGISNELSLTWLPDGQITCDGQRSDQSIWLHCLWPGGYPPAQVQMIYQSLNITQVDEVRTNVPVFQFPLGMPLSCTGTHQGSSQSCLLVIDTPQYPGFINDSTRAGKKGSSVFLPVTLGSGKAVQVFPSKFSWFKLEPNLTELFNGKNISVISDDYSSFLIVHSMTKEITGHYMCKAVNAIGTNSFTFKVEVEKENALSGGAIAGIVIGCFAVLALIAIAVILVKNLKGNSRTSQTQTLSQNCQAEQSQHIYERNLSSNNTNTYS
ncbi:pregnancy-specific beta-1-glycoprotein 7-like isoform X3 [Pyxicephalus adspersus]|uniref:pregnancy-specific beta-1-glycoprotein 7-like isoform X3 n=1 Tax=Pyxicephalus adspersus TaxID=30357 RepID=UPI003B5B9742